MTGDGIRSAALAYCRQVLARTAYFVDSAQTEEDWTARLVVVEERERKGSAEPKRWHALYEVHLDAELRPLYHVKRGYWDKGLPAGGSVEVEPEAVGPPETSAEAALPPGPAEPAEAAGGPAPEAPAVPVERASREAAMEPGPGESSMERAPGESSVEQAPGEESRDDGPQTRLRIGFVAPRAGDGAGESAHDGSEGVERHPGSGELSRAATGCPADPGAGGAVGDVREEARPEMTESDFVGGFPVEVTEGQPAEEQAAEPTEAEVLQEMAPEAGPGGTEGITLTEAPAEVAAPGAPPGPSRPSVQERQGPPRVSFRFASNNDIRSPEEGK